MAFRNSKIVLIILQIAAFWSVWQWYGSRLLAAGDEFYGVLSLAAIILICIGFGKFNPQKGCANFYPILFSVFVYAAAFSFLPPMMRAAICATSLTLTISDCFFARRFHLGVWILSLLCLPFIASLQFYLGFPLRVIVGEATVILLKLNGLSVIRDGIALYFGEQTIWIDAPCSGVKMIWSGVFLTSILITIYNFRLPKSLAALSAAFLIIIAGNVFRSTGLFYLESGIVKMPAFAHDAIGITAFILTCAAIVSVILKLRDFDLLERKITPGENAKALPLSRFKIWLAGCVFASAFFTPFFGVERKLVSPDASAAAIVFPSTFENKKLHEIGLTEREEFFMEDFPGQVKRFTDGRREIIVRYVTEATRKLHSSSDCLTAIGYKIEPLSLEVDNEKQKWSCFSASRKDERLRVCERIYSESGESWTDVSAWYWSAVSTSGSRRYWVYTVAETLDAGL